MRGVWRNGQPSGRRAGGERLCMQKMRRRYRAAGRKGAGRNVQRKGAGCAEDIYRKYLFTGRAFGLNSAFINIKIQRREKVWRL